MLLAKHVIAAGCWDFIRRDFTRRFNRLTGVPRKEYM